MFVFTKDFSTEPLSSPVRLLLFFQKNLLGLGHPHLRFAETVGGSLSAGYDIYTRASGRFP